MTYDKGVIFPNLHFKSYLVYSVEIDFQSLDEKWYVSYIYFHVINKSYSCYTGIILEAKIAELVL